MTRRETRTALAPWPGTFLVLGSLERRAALAEAGYDFTYEDLVTGAGTAIHSIRAFAGYTGKLTETTGLEGALEGLCNVNALETGGRTIDAFEDNRVNSKLALTTQVFGDVSFRFSFEAHYDHAPAPRPPFGIPFAPGYQPLADELDTKTEAVLIVNFLQGLAPRTICARRRRAAPGSKSLAAPASRVHAAAMDEMIEGLVSKVGLSREKAEQVVQFVKDNASRLPEWLGQSGVVKDLAARIPGLGALTR